MGKSDLYKSVCGKPGPIWIKICIKSQSRTVAQLPGFASPALLGDQVLCSWKLTKYVLQHSTFRVCTVCYGHGDFAVGRALHWFCARVLRGWLYSPSNCFITSNPLRKKTQPKSQQQNISPLIHGSSQERENVD